MSNDCCTSTGSEQSCESKTTPRPAGTNNCSTGNVSLPPSVAELPGQCSHAAVAGLLREHLSLHGEMEAGIGFTLDMPGDVPSHLFLPAFLPAEDWILSFGLRVMLMGGDQLGELLPALMCTAQLPADGAEEAFDQKARDLLTQCGVAVESTFRLCLLLRPKGNPDLHALRQRPARCGFDAEPSLIWLGSTLSRMSRDQLLELSQSTAHVLQIAEEVGDVGAHQ